MVTHVFYPHIGGIERAVEELSKRLIERGHEIFIITPRLKGTKTFEDYKGMKIIRTDSMEIPVYNPPILLSNPSEEIENLVKKEGIDLIHLHQRFYYNISKACIKTKKKFNIPLIYSIHDPSPIHVENLFLRNLGIFYDKIWGKNLIKNSDALIAGSKFTEDEIRKNLNCKKDIHIIPYGVDTSLFRPLNLKKEKTILSVGRLTPEKGFKYLIEAFRIISKKHPEYKLVIVGTGPELENLKKISNNLNVEFLHNVKDQELVELYNKSALFALPSMLEGFGLVVLEALSCGLPIVATNVGAIKEIVGESGVVVEPENSIKLAKGIERVIENQKLMKGFQKNAIKRAKTFDWNVMSEKTENIYEEAL
jgi:glycosyltransferase involved in cell wall biosynthesis